MKLVQFWALLLLCASPSWAIDNNLPDLGEASQTVFTPQIERKVGEAIMRDIRSDPAYLDDPEITGYLNSLGYRLAAASPNNRQDFNFFVVRDNTLNAFALPGGYVGVHTGLILATQSESELAGVLAHEIAHVTQRHIARLVAQDSRNSIISIAALALAILTARANPQVGSAAGALAQAGSIQSSLDFTRENESEADRVGFQILTEAGLDPHGMASFFERLSKSNRLYDNNAPVYLRSHPLTTQRIADIENRLVNVPYRQVPDSLDFQMVRAKVRAYTGRPDEAVAWFDSGLKEQKYNSEVAQRYGLTQALLRAKQTARAERELAQLKKIAPTHAMIESLAADLKRAQGQDQAALAIYRAALKLFPFQRALIYGYVETLLATRQYAEAVNFASEDLKRYAGDDRLYEYQARGYAGQKKDFLSHRALAEAYARRGNLGAAIEQLQIALKTREGDFYQLSSAEARLKELKALDAEARR
jgi:predicted Zn-dependent protease